MEIREARPADVTPLVKYCRKAHAESDWNWVPFSPAALRKSIHKMMRSPAHIVLIAKDAQISGFLFGAIDSFIYGNTLYATDIEFFADRGGKELMDAFRQWAVQHNAAVRIHAVSNRGREAVKDRWYRMRGMERVGGLYSESLKG